MIDSQRSDRRGHWPRGVPRSRVNPDRYQTTIQRVRTLLETSHQPGLISRCAIATAISVNERSVRRWVDGEDVPTRQHLAALERWLNDTTRRLRRRKKPSN